MIGLTKMIQIFADDHSNLYLNEIYKSFLSRNLSLNSKDITTTKNMERQINSRFKCWVPFIGSWARPAGNMVRGSIPEGERKAHTHCNERKVHRKPWFVVSGLVHWKWISVLTFHCFKTFLNSVQWDSCGSKEEVFKNVIGKSLCQKLCYWIFIQTSQCSR